MIVLVDEGLSVAFSKAVELRLPEGWVCHTVSSVGWAGRSNGDLHRAAAEAGYVALVTRDLNMAYQTPARLPVMVVPTTGRLRMAEQYAEIVAEKLGRLRLAVEYQVLDPLEGEDFFEHRQRQVAAIRRHQQRQRQRQWGGKGSLGR